METSKIILEYLKIILTGPVLFSTFGLVFILLFREDLRALILRVAKIKLPGGTELSTPQSTQSDNTEKPNNKPPIKDEEIGDLPSDLTIEQQDQVKQLIRSHVATAYMWEYRYLNYYYVRSTQLVLDWFIGLNEATTYAYYESVWIPSIPTANERLAIINVLKTHHLLYEDSSGLISVNPKGLEYAAWRGAVPQLTNQ